MNRKKEAAPTEGRLYVRFAIGLTFALLCGVLLGAARWYFDDVARAYFQNGQGDLVFSYLQYFVNQSTFVNIGIFLLAEVFFIALKNALPRLNGPFAFFARLLIIAVLLFAAAIYNFHKQHWFPLARSRRLMIYAATFAGAGVIALAYLKFRGSQLARGFDRALALPAIGAFILIAALNVSARFKKQQSRNRSPNVVVILVDALRYDHVGCYGYSRPTSPALDAFAQESLLFTQAISQSSYTKPVIASLFTSLYPSQHNVFRNTRHDAAGNFISDVLDDSFKTMAEYLRDAGFNTAGFLEQAQLRNYMGFAQGFYYYKPDMGTAPEINRGFFKWLPLNKHRKFFAYLHYLDTHAPYAPPPKYRDLFGEFDHGANIPERVKDWQKFKAEVTDGSITLTQTDAEQLMALYDAEIRAFDDDMKALFAKLKEEGVYDNSLIIITADHGDEFLEHGSVDHAHTLYDELLRVPLMIRFPKGEHRGVVNAQVQIIDLLPTILEFCNIELDTHLMGHSLLAYKDGVNGHEEIPVFSERADLISLRTGRYKYIYNVEEKAGELYDLQNDPSESKNLVEEDRQTAERMKNEILRWVEITRQATSEQTGVKIDDKSVKELRSLGYIR
jgi:arylsulfatase A-like enzyme